MKKIIFNLDGCGFCHFSLIGLSQPVQAANSASIAGTVTTASGASTFVLLLPHPVKL